MIPAKRWADLAEDQKVGPAFLAAVRRDAIEDVAQWVELTYFGEAREALAAGIRELKPSGEARE